MKERGCIFSVESLFMSLLKRQLILFPGRWFGKGIFSVESIFILLNLFGVAGQYLGQCVVCWKVGVLGRVQRLLDELRL